MENIIILVIVVISVVLNIIKNYKKQSAENAKRQIGKKPQGQAMPPVPQTVYEERTIQADRPVRKERRDVLESLDDILESIPSRKEEYTSPMVPPKYEIHTANNSIYNYSDEIRGLEEEDYYLLTEEIGQEPRTDKVTENIHSFFETKDDLKKAIIYSAILERKF